MYTTSALQVRCRSANFFAGKASVTGRNVLLRQRSTFAKEKLIHLLDQKLLRLALAARPLISRIRDSGVLDSGGGISHFSSLVVAEFMGSGGYARNVERLREAYRQRRDALLAALTEDVADRATWLRPAGGYFIWLTLPQGRDARTYLSAAEREGTSYMPGATFYLGGGEGGGNLRLAFSRYAPDLLVEAAGRLARALGGR